MKQNTDCWRGKGGETRLSKLQFIRRFRKQRHCQRPERLISSPTAQILLKRPRCTCECHQEISAEAKRGVCSAEFGRGCLSPADHASITTDLRGLNRLLRAVGQAALKPARIVFCHKMQAVSCLFRVAVNTFGGRSSADAIVTVALCDHVYEDILSNLKSQLVHGRPRSSQGAPEAPARTGSRRGRNSREGRRRT